MPKGEPREPQKDLTLEDIKRRFDMRQQDEVDGPIIYEFKNKHLDYDLVLESAKGKVSKSEKDESGKEPNLSGEEKLALDIDAKFQKIRQEKEDAIQEFRRLHPENDTSDSTVP